MTSIDWAEEIRRLALCHKLTHKDQGQHHTPLAVTVDTGSRSFYQQTAFDVTAEALPGYSGSVRATEEAAISFHHSGCVGSSQAPAAVGQTLSDAVQRQAVQEVLLMSTLCTLHIPFLLQGAAKSK